MRPDWHPRRLDLVHDQPPQLMDDPVAPGKPRARQEYSFPLVSAYIQSTKLRGNFGALRGSSPDAWGRKLIEKRISDPAPTEVQYLLNSPDDRAGALAFGLNQVPPAPVHIFNKTLDLARLIETAKREPRNYRTGL